MDHCKPAARLIAATTAALLLSGTQAHAVEWRTALDYSVETFAVIDGGQARGEVVTGLANLSLGFEGDAWSGFANAYVAHGNSVSERYLGDFSVVSNIDTATEPRLQEIWLQWPLGNGSLRAGMLAADSEFWGSEYGALFLNSTFGAPSHVSANLPNPSIFPVATLGLRLDQDLGNGRLWRIAALDGDAGDLSDDNPHGLDTRWGRGAVVPCCLPNSNSAPVTQQEVTMSLASASTDTPAPSQTSTAATVTGCGVHWWQWIAPLMTTFPGLLAVTSRSRPRASRHGRRNWASTGTTPSVAPAHSDSHSGMLR